MSFIRLATRKSRLALFQSNLVRQEIQAADPTVEVELVEVTTTGDQKRDWSLEKQGGTGLFTKELESFSLMVLQILRCTAQRTSQPSW